jgi:hypothetical protein
VRRIVPVEVLRAILEIVEFAKRGARERKPPVRIGGARRRAKPGVGEG